MILIILCTEKPIPKIILIIPETILPFTTQLNPSFIAHLTIEQQGLLQNW